MQNMGKKKSIDADFTRVCVKMASDSRVQITKVDLDYTRLIRFTKSQKKKSNSSSSANEMYQTRKSRFFNKWELKILRSFCQSWPFNICQVSQNELQNKTLNLLAVVQKINTQTWSLTATTLKPLMIVTVVLEKTWLLAFTWLLRFT